MKRINLIFLILSTSLVNVIRGDIDYDTYSVCHAWSYGRTQDNVAYMCNHQALGSCQLRQAALDDGYASFAEYGFGGYGFDQQSSCCRCFQLQLQDEFAPDKDLIVQGINTGTDALHGQIDLSMIAGGFGLNNGCANKVFAYTGQQWDGIAGPAQYSNSKAGDWCSDPSSDNSTCQNIYAGGIRKRVDCKKLPTQELRDLCDYSFETRWRSESVGMRNTLMKEIRCPAGLRRVSGCDRDDPSLPDPSGRLKAGDPGVTPGIMTTMWDCCKVSCAWKGNVVNAKGTAVMSCDNNGNILGLGKKMECQSLKCHESCASCKVENDPNQCTSCRDGYYLSNNQCKLCDASQNCKTCQNLSKCTSCNDGDIIWPDGTCKKPCHPSCDTCSEPDNQNKCTSCQIGQYLENGQCISCPESQNCNNCKDSNYCYECKPGFDLKDDHTCVPGCDISCLTCSSPQNANACTSCFDGLYLNSSGQCVFCPSNCTSCTSETDCTACISGFALENGVCKPCLPECKYCENTVDFCIECSNPNQIAVNGRCENCQSPCNTCQDTTSKCTSCVSGYELKDNNICEKIKDVGNCHSSCLTCFKPNDQNACSTCNDGYLILGVGNCQPCQPQCKTCSNGNPSYCTSCKDGYKLEGNTCVYDSQGQSNCYQTCKTCTIQNNPSGCTSCIDGYVLQGNTCQPCQPQCKTCSGDPISCTSCQSNYKLEGNTCVPDSQGSQNCYQTCKTCTIYNNPSGCTSCNDGYVLQGNTCQPCQPQCQTCSDNPNSCTSCHQNYKLEGNTCVADTQNSSNCYQTCMTCSIQNNPSGCTSCYDGYVLQGNTCQLCQPQCKSCVNNPVQCTECSIGFGMRNGYCVRLWANSLTCHSSCSTCEQPQNPYACVTCPAGSQITQQNTCVSCPNGNCRLRNLAQTSFSKMLKISFSLLCFLLILF